MRDKLRAKGLHDTRCRNEEVRGSGSALEDVRGGGSAQPAATSGHERAVKREAAAAAAAAAFC
jgi:hypothetical protein